MQLTETKSEGLAREYTATIPASELEATINEKLVAARADFAMKGFRKGKAPMSLMKKMFGQNLLGEAVQEGIDNGVRAHFEESGHRPAQNPDIKVTNEDFKEGDDIQISVAYEMLPEIPEVDYSGVSVEKLTVAVEDSAVDEAIANLAKNATDYAARKKGSKAKDGDQVVINFLGKVDGEAFEGGAADDYPLVLGSNSFIPGFEEQLVGTKAGDEKNVEVSFPEEYGAEHLAGKAAVFEVKVNEVKEPKDAEINDDLAVKFGAENLDDLKAKIKDRIGEEYGQGARALTKRKVLDALDGLVSFELPQSLAAAEANQIAHQLWHEENPEVEGHDHPEIEPTDEHKSLAERRVRLGLLLAEIGGKAEIQVTDAEVNSALMRQASQYPGMEQQFFEYARNNPEMQQQLRAPIFEDKTIDYILERATVTEKSVTKEELEAALEALDKDQK